MEVKTNFETFQKGDIVRVKPGFPYINRVLLDGEIYTIDKMIADAGVVTLKGLPYNQTFPDEAFELIIGDSNGKKD